MKKVLIFSIIIALMIIFLGFAFGFFGITEHFDKKIFYIGNPETAIKNHMQKEYNEIIDKYNTEYKNDRLSFFNFFIDTIEKSYVFLNEKEKNQNFSFEELKDFYRNKVSLAKNKENFNYLIFELQSILNDPNLKVNGIMEDIKTIPINFEFNGNLIIKSYNVDYFLENSIPFDIKEGLILKEIDGESAKEIINKVKNLTFYKNLNSKSFSRIFFSSYYNYFRKDENYSELVFTDGKKDYTININYEKFEDFYNNGNFITEKREDVKGMESKIIGGNIGYLKIDSFDFVNFQDTLKKEIEKIKLTDILIVDLRNISGENFQNIKYFISFFEENKIFGYKKQNINHYLSVISDKYIKQNNELIKFETGEAPIKYDKDVVFIFDETHNNHKNLLLSYFESFDYAHFIGEEYILHSSESLFVKTPWNYNFVIPYMQYYNENKELIEGEDFKPDVEVPFVNTQIFGEDFYLETAYNYALTLINK